MGHTRLGKIPTARKWKDVISIISDSIISSSSIGGSAIPKESLTLVADTIITGASSGLKEAKNDLGLATTFFVFLKIAQLSKESWSQVCNYLEVKPDAIQTNQDFTLEVQYKIDRLLIEKGASTDISEIALQSLGTALNNCLGSDSNFLFENSLAVFESLRKSSTKKGVSKFGQIFFGEFTSRFLNFYLSRISSYNINPRENFHIPDINRLNKEFYQHCYQTSLIVKDFSGEWYSKAKYEERLNLSSVQGFVAVALEKIIKELKIQREGL